MNCNTTYSTRKIEDVTFDDLVRTSNMLKKLKPPYEVIQMCKKHWKLLSKQLKAVETVEDKFMPYFATGMLGMRVEIKPYLKKVRLLTRKEPSSA